MRTHAIQEETVECTLVNVPVFHFLCKLVNNCGIAMTSC